MLLKSVNDRELNDCIYIFRSSSGIQTGVSKESLHQTSPGGPGLECARETESGSTDQGRHGTEVLKLR